jgi:hypothetical protein
MTHSPLSIFKGGHATAQMLGGSCAFANAVSAEEAQQPYDRWVIPAPGKPLFEAATASFDLIERPDRAHSLTIDSRRHEVADTVPTWLARQSVAGGH